MSKPVAASDLPVHVAAANVHKADFPGPSVSSHAQTAHGLCAGMTSTTQTQQLGSTPIADTPRMVASHSDKTNAGPQPRQYGRLESRSHAPAPFMPTLTESAGTHRYGYGSPIAMPAIRTASTIYGNTSR